MTLSSLDRDPSSALITHIYWNDELVRGSEARVIDELLPLVRHESVALNLSGVERIDAAGIAALITLYCTSVQYGNDFSVVDPSPRVLELLQIVGLERILMAQDEPRPYSSRLAARQAESRLQSCA